MKIIEFLWCAESDISDGERVAFFQAGKIPIALMVELWDMGLRVTAGEPIAPMRIPRFLEKVALIENDLAADPEIAACAVDVREQFTRILGMPGRPSMPNRRDRGGRPVVNYFKYLKEKEDNTKINNRGGTSAAPRPCATIIRRRGTSAA